MVLIEQKPNLCYYACVESFCKSNGINIDHEDLYIRIRKKAGRDLFNLLDAMSPINEIIGDIEIKKGEDNLNTEEIGRNYFNRYIIVVLKRKCDGSFLDKLVGVTHAVLMRKTKSHFEIMDPMPWHNYPNLKPIFEHYSNGGTIIEKDPKKIDAMRTSENNCFLEFFVIGTKSTAGV